MKRLFSALTVFMVACLVAIAAPGTINCKGIVVDNEGEPVAGATVSLAGGRALGATDVDGRFTVAVPSSSQIAITFVGF